MAPSKRDCLFNCISIRRIIATLSIALLPKTYHYLFWLKKVFFLPKDTSFYNLVLNLEPHLDPHFKQILHFLCGTEY